MRKHISEESKQVAKWLREAVVAMRREDVGTADHCLYWMNHTIRYHEAKATRTRRDAVALKKLHAFAAAMPVEPTEADYESLDAEFSLAMRAIAE